MKVGRNGNNYSFDSCTSDRIKMGDCIGDFWGDRISVSVIGYSTVSVIRLRVAESCVTPVMKISLAISIVRDCNEDQKSC